MTTFVDTAALYALLDEDDPNHDAAVGWLTGPRARPDELLVSHNYVVVESAALVHRRLGARAVRVLLDAFIPALSVAVVDEVLHRSGVISYRSALGKRTSLVDHVSFEFMRWRSIDSAFTFDRDFRRQGFTTVP